jgi:hypothetical protein
MSNDLTDIIKELLDSNAVMATQYVSDKGIVRVTRTVFNGRFNRGNIELRVTFGKPNFRERKFIKLCKKSGEPFPVKKIQFKFLQKKKK